MSEEIKSNNKVNVSLPINEEEKRRASAIAAANGLSFRNQVAIWIRDAIDRRMVSGKLVIR